MTLTANELDAVAHARRHYGHPEVAYPEVVGQNDFAALRDACVANNAPMPYDHPAIAAPGGLVTDYGRYTCRPYSMPAVAIAWLRSNTLPGWDIRVQRRNGQWYVSALPLPVQP